MKTLLLIDGNAIMHRAYHALPPFKTRQGFPTNAVFGFFSILNKVTTDYKPNYLIVCFDTPVPTFRKKMFKEYQSHRPKMESELSSQFSLVKEGLESTHIIHIEKEGYEADDVIGTIANLFNNSNNRVYILSGDRDILQLVNDKTYVITPQLGFSKEKIYDKKEVINKFGIDPTKIPDFKALMGDSSDNYHGAKGIGPKTAAKLLQKYGSVDNVLKNLETIDGRIQQILKDHVDMVKMSYRLATILTNVDIKIDQKTSEFNGFDENLKEFFIKYEMYSLTSRIFPKKTDKEKIISRKSKNENQIGLF